MTVPAARDAGGALAASARLDADEDWPAAFERVLADPAAVLVVHQPIVEVRTGRVVGHEAFTRFVGPPWSRPDRWFAAAQRLGLREQLEAHVVESILAARPQLESRAGSSAAPAWCTVNVGVEMLNSAQLLPLLARGRRIDGVVFELTRRPLPEQEAQLRHRMARVRAAGGRIAMEENDGGYVAQRQLAALGPEVVHIGRALVEALPKDRLAARVVTGIVAAARERQATLVAQGVENGEQLEAVLATGIGLAQGWLLGRPGQARTELTAEAAAAVRPFRR